MIMKGKGLLVGLRLAKIDETYTSWDLLNPMMSPTSDQDWISLNCINTIPSSPVMRIKKSINLGIISWSNNEFS